jgi:hypothetical protein
MTDPEIRAQLAAAGLGAFADRVIAEAVDELWISTTRTDSFALGQSRIGGTPDLPRGTPWPRHRWTHAETATWPEWDQQDLRDALISGEVIEDGDGVALALPFVAQLDLADLAPLQSVLPRTGHLWLFADQQTTLGAIEDYPYQASACLYTEPSELVPTSPPPVPEQLPGLALAFARGRVYPDAGALDLRGDDWNRYEAALSPLRQRAPTHAVLPGRFGGVIGDIPPPSYSGLLRVDSDYTLDEVINWGDAAWITFALPPDALAARRFDELRAFRFCG